MASATFYIGTVTADQGVLQLRGRLVRGQLREGMQALVDHQPLVIDFLETEAEVITLAISTSGSREWLESLVGREVEFIDEDTTPLKVMNLGTETA